MLYYKSLYSFDGAFFKWVFILFRLWHTWLGHQSIYLKPFFTSNFLVTSFGKKFLENLMNKKKCWYWGLSNHFVLDRVGSSIMVYLIFFKILQSPSEWLRQAARIFKRIQYLFAIFTYSSYLYLISFWNKRKSNQILKNQRNLDNPFVAELTQNNAVGRTLQIYVGLTLRNTNQ